MHRLISFALLALLLAACAGAQPPSVLSSYDLPASVEITFNALLPENSPAGDSISFTVLDEVTGLEFNPQHMAMQASGEHSVSITLSVPAGTLLKYHYTRQAAAGAVGETSADGAGISYRAYWVDGPGHVAHDMVAAWADLPQTLATGQVSGVVTDAATGQPIPDIAVVAAGIQTLSDAEGHFVIAGLPQGLHNLLAISPNGNYLPFQQGALVAADSDTPAAVQLASNPTAAVTFWFTPPNEHTAGTPVFLAGSVNAFAARPLLALQADGRYSVTLQLPTGVDLRYKYTLGDGFWNAEHFADGSFSVRQLIIPAGTTVMEIEDEVASWSAGSTAPIWFDLTAPAEGPLVYVQFKLVDWGTPLPMWPLGDGHWAYKLYSPTNFANPLEYRYCLDAACTVLEAAPGLPRTVVGNQEALQQIEDHVDAWQ